VGPTLDPRAFARFVYGEGGFFNPETQRTYLDFEMRNDLIQDCGDADIAPTNVERSFASATEMRQQILARGGLPVVIGGDHSITYPIVREFTERLHVIHFDAHIDYSPFVHDLAAKFGARRVYASHEEILADPDVEMIDVCTPTHTHLELSLAAIAAGKHVLSVGIAGAALEAALAWSKQREVGGAPIAELQGIQWMLADMATDLDAARLLGLRAAALRQSGARFSAEASMAKLYASEGPSAGL